WHLLLDAARGLRRCLRRLDGREGILVRGALREAALVAVDRRLRVRLSRSVAAARPGRLLQRALLRARRRDRRRALAVPRERAGLRLRDRARPARLLLDALAQDLCLRRRHRQARVDLPRREVLADRLGREVRLSRRVHEPVCDGASMRYAVTGAAGFIGSHLAEALAAAGHDVLGIDCLTDYYDREIKEDNARGLELQRLDLADDTLDLSGFDGVFHLACQPGIRSFGDVFPAYVRNNVVASQRLFEAAA